MSTKRAYYIMCGIVVILLVGIIGGAYGIQTLLKSESTKLVNLKAKADALTQQQVSLKKAKKDIATYTDLYTIAKIVVPENKDQVQAVRQIVKLADENKIVLDSINFPASTLGATTATKPAGAASANTSATSGSKPSLSQLTQVPKIPGVYTLQLTVTSDPNKLATYAELISFLSALENNRQTALVSTINIAPDDKNHNLFSFNLTLDTFIKP